MTPDEKKYLSLYLSSVKVALQRIWESPNDADLEYINAVKMCYVVGEHYKHLIEPEWFTNTENEEE